MSLELLASRLLLMAALLLALAWGLGTLLTDPPACWEDEVIVLVVQDPFRPDSGLVGTVGCVPADNLPVSGFRP